MTERLSILLLLAPLLTGCPRVSIVGASSAGAISSVTTPGVSASAPVALTGIPAASVTVGAQYSFQPVVSPSGVGVTFTILGQPTWSNFDATSGALSGTPSASDEGESANITITAHDNGASDSIGPFNILVNAPAAPPPKGTATLSWAAPKQNVDDPVALTKAVNLTGTASTIYVVTGLNTGTYYFAVSAHNAEGIESSLSSVGNKTI